METSFSEKHPHLMHVRSSWSLLIPSESSDAHVSYPNWAPDFSPVLCVTILRRGSRLQEGLLVHLLTPLKFAHTFSYNPCVGALSALSSSRGSASTMANPKARDHGATVPYIRCAVIMRARLPPSRNPLPRLIFHW